MCQLFSEIFTSTSTAHFCRDETPEENDYLRLCERCGPSSGGATFANLTSAVAQQAQSLTERAMIVSQHPPSQDHCVDPDTMHHDPFLRNCLRLYLVHVVVENLPRPSPAAVSRLDVRGEEI
jgi:hypothetical protein